jgi:hypothetical protein
MVTKTSDNKIRFCCDFRRVNDLSANDCLSTPRIDDILDSLSGNHWLSKLDLRSGYWQCGLKECAREKTAFCIPGSVIDTTKITTKTYFIIRCLSHHNYW